MDLLQGGQGGDVLALVQQEVLGLSEVVAAAQQAGRPLLQADSAWLAELQAQAEAAATALVGFEVQVLPAMVGCAASGPSAAMLQVGAACCPLHRKQLRADVGKLRCACMAGHSG